MKKVWKREISQEITNILEFHIYEILGLDTELGVLLIEVSLILYIRKHASCMLLCTWSFERSYERNLQKINHN